MFLSLSLSLSLAPLSLQRYTIFCINGSLFIQDMITANFTQHILSKPVLCMYVYIRFKMFFYVVRHLDSIASYLPTGLHLGFFRSSPSLFLPSSFSSVFLVFSFVLASTSMLFWAIFFLPFFEHCLPCELVLFNLFYNCFLYSSLLSYVGCGI